MSTSCLEKLQTVQPRCLPNESPSSEVNTEDAQELEAGVRRHPLGVRPGGNGLTAQRDLRSRMGSFNGIPDELMLTLLEWLDGDALRRLGSTSKALYAYCTCDQLWRDLWIATSLEKQMTWRGSWRASFLGLPSESLPDVDCSDLFSDAIYRPFLCSQIPLRSYAANIPPANLITRFADLTSEEFASKWTDKPFILTLPVRQWPVFQNWSEKQLLIDFGQTNFRAESVDWPLRTYVEYMLNNQDESPLYLFDRTFVQKMGLRVEPGGAYWSPLCFGEDFFEVLSDQRPDHRWLIVGPARSGSTFHKDPNATSAWNAVIRGSKYWIMFPRSIIPPGVYMSDDESEVTSPLSIAEWLLEFHEEARGTPGCIEGICEEGEVLHVPSGWWHLVVNLDNAIAITQNFVPRSHLQAAIDFLKRKPDQVSGFKSEVRDPFSLFMTRLKAHHPELAVSEQESAKKKRKWEDIIQGDSSQPTEAGRTFGFSFGGDSDGEGEIP